MKTENKNWLDSYLDMANLQDLEHMSKQLAKKSLVAHKSSNHT
jgi:acyl carrier protein phosphodiesterase